MIKYGLLHLVNKYMWEEKDLNVMTFSKHFMASSNKQSVSYFPACSKGERGRWGNCGFSI